MPDEKIVSPASNGADKSKIVETPPAPRNKKTNPLHKVVTWFHALSKKQKIVFIVTTIVVLAGATTGLVLALQKDPQPAVKTVAKKVEPKTEVPKPATEASTLSGLQVDPSVNKRPVTGVMIENSPEARPQSGLTSASVVFEAIAEGGITRFLALFQDTQPDYIGPVRSVRPYYLDWLQGFDAPVAHAGGSNDGLAKVKADKVKDLDQFANAKAYQRVNSRYAPHNLYTSTAKLDALEVEKGFTSSTFEGFARKAESKSATPDAKSIDLTISGYYYNPHYDYDAASNTYKRSMQGKPHIDEKSGTQIAPKVVIANIMQYKIIDSVGHSGYNTIGSGTSYIFQDGTVTIGTWEKTSSKSQIVFKDKSGAIIKLNPGQTWLAAVGDDTGVQYKP